jgi:hypothetical protein
MRVVVSILRTAVWGAALGLWLVSASAWAQTTGGVFAKLSPGEQKIARALFEAQTRSTAPGAPRPLTLNQIAARKQSHEGWGEVFKGMKRQGLLTEKNLGQVVSRFEEQHHETHGAGTGRTHEETNKGMLSGTGRGIDGGVSTATGRGEGFGSSGASEGIRGGRGGGVGHGGGGRR